MENVTYSDNPPSNGSKKSATIRSDPVEVGACRTYFTFYE